MRRIQTKMAAYISSSSTPKINWAAQDMSLEYLNFEDMCEMMFYGPLAEHKDNDKAKFSYMSLWGGPKALELLHNSALCNQKTSKNLLLVLKDYCNDNDNDNEISLFGHKFIQHYSARIRGKILISKLLINFSFD